MYQQRLKKILFRFKLTDYPNLIDECDILSEAKQSFDFNKTKKSEFVNFILGLRSLRPSKEKLKKGVPLLELLYIRRNSSTKLWNVLKLIRAKETHFHGDKEKTEESLQDNLSLFFTPEVSVIHEEGLIWIRIQAYEDIRKPAKSSPAFFVYHPTSDVLLSTKLHGKLAQSIMQGVMLTLGCSRAEQLQLCGRDINSLLQLVMNKYCKSSLNLNSFDAKRKRGQKRKAPKDADFDQHIIQENTVEKRLRQRRLEKTFGSNILPGLETLEYSLETPFRGLTFAPAMTVHNDEEFRCRVKFSGKNVLEGIRELGLAGIAPLPMRNHVGKVHRMTRNTFILKKKTNQNQSSTMDGTVQDMTLDRSPAKSPRSGATVNQRKRKSRTQRI